MGAQQWRAKMSALAQAIRKTFSGTISIILKFSGSDLEILGLFERGVKSYRAGKDRKMNVIPLYLTSECSIKSR